MTTRIQILWFVTSQSGRRQTYRFQPKLRSLGWWLLFRSSFRSQSSVDNTHPWITRSALVSVLSLRGFGIFLFTTLGGSIHLLWFTLVYYRFSEKTILSKHDTATAVETGNNQVTATNTHYGKQPFDICSRLLSLDCNWHQVSHREQWDLYGIKKQKNKKQKNNIIITISLVSLTSLNRYNTLHSIKNTIRLISFSQSFRFLSFSLNSIPMRPSIYESSASTEKRFPLKKPTSPSWRHIRTLRHILNTFHNDN